MEEVLAQDLVNILTQQRNAAMDEIARQGAMIRGLQREVAQLKTGRPDPGGLNRKIAG